MFEEVVKIFGLDKPTIVGKLQRFANCGVEFDVEENCLDALITMRSNLDKDRFDYIKTYVYNTFEDEVYSSRNESLSALAAILLKLNKRTISVAESLTGGGICSALTEIPGISQHFFEGVVCYNKNSKMARLGVPRNVIESYGTVSRQTAYEMVRGITSTGGADIGIATTGLAGPTGDEGKPVGLVYIGVGGGSFITVFEKRFSGTRDEIRKKTINAAFFYLIRYLKGNIFSILQDGVPR